MLCNASPRKTKKTKQQRRMVIKNREMKHKDHVRKTQLDILDRYRTENKKKKKEEEKEEEKEKNGLAIQCLIRGF